MKVYKKINDFYKSGYEEYKEKYEKQKKYIEDLHFFYSHPENTQNLDKIVYMGYTLKELYEFKEELDKIKSESCKCDSMTSTQP